MACIAVLIHHTETLAHQRSNQIDRFLGFLDRTVVETSVRTINYLWVICVSAIPHQPRQIERMLEQLVTAVKANGADRTGPNEG